MVQKQQVVTVIIAINLYVYSQLIFLLDTVYVVHNQDSLIHYDDSHVDEVSIETINSHYIKV